jgi:peptidyl-prolyl cis-trans isomerase D
MMRQMRENTKWIMLITAAAFVALMVFEWGMDMSGQSAGGGNVGRVGSTNVSVQHYQSVYRNLYDQISRAQDRPVSQAQNREIEDMAWNEVVDQILIQMELERRGIAVSDDEIRQAARFSPPPGFRDEPAFQTDGQFDPQRYQEWLAQIAAYDPQTLYQLEQYYRDVIPRSKLMRQIMSGVFVSDRELWQAWRDRNEAVEASYLSLRADDHVADDEVPVSREEIERYYRDNRDEFAVPARADVRYTWISKAPTAEDSAAVRERAEELRRELIEGADFADVADRESADRASAAQGGSVGTIRPGDVPAAFEAAALSLPVGEIGEPVRTSFGWHIIEVTDRDDEAEEAEVRHVLLEIERSDDSEIRLLTRADSLESLGRTRTIADAASELGLPVFEGEITEEFAILAGVGRAEEGQDWIFEDREGVGAVSPVFESGEAFYMLEILDEAPAGYLPLAQVAAEIEDQLRLERKIDRTREIAREIVAELRDGPALEEVAARRGLEVQSAGPFTRSDEFVPGLGSRNAAVGAAFGVPEGEVGGPVRVDDRFVIVRVDRKIEAEREAWEAQKEVQRAQMTAQLRQARLERWLEGLRETVRIVDNRAEFFRRAEEQADAPQMPMVL